MNKPEKVGFLRSAEGWHHSELALIYLFIADSVMHLNPNFEYKKFTHGTVMFRCFLRFIVLYS